MVGRTRSGDFGVRLQRARRSVARLGSRVGVAGVPLAHRVSAEDLLVQQLQSAGLSGWTREHRFHPVRKWRFDLAHIELKIAVEVEGFAPGGRAGRHQRVAGFTADAEKYAEAAIAGWRLIRVTTRQVREGKALGWIERAISG